MEALDWVREIWMSRSFEVCISVASMALALWMGLYLLRRGAGTAVGLLGACALLLLALIYALEAMLDTPGITRDQYELLLRTQALTMPSSLGVWVCLALLVRNRRRITAAVKRASLVIGAIGASQAWLGAFTNWYYDYAHIYPSPFPRQDWWTPRGPGFATFAVLVLAGLLWSVYNVFRPFYDEAGSLRAIVRVERFWPLFLGAFLFLLSVGYLVIAYTLGTGGPEVIGLAGVSLGVVALGFGIFWHNTLVEEGRDIATDFLYSLAGMGAVLTLYAVIIYLVMGFQSWSVGPLVAIVAALVITHSLHDITYRLFDALLERVGLTRWTTRHRLRREKLLRAQRQEKSRDTLREHLAALLDQLCREVSTNRGYVALRDGQGFTVQATYGVPPPVCRLTLPELVSGSITTIPNDLESADEFKGIGIIVPLSTRGRQVGVVVLGEKRYDDGEINRVIVHAEAMQRAIEALEVAEAIERLQRKLARLQRQRKPAVAGEDDRSLLALCAKSGLSFRNVAEVIAAATEMLENYLEDPYALDTSPFLRCSRVQSRLGRGRDQSEAVALLEAEIASTIAAMRPSRSQGYDWRRWTYLYQRYIDRYDENGRRITMEDIARATGVSRKTLARHHDRAIRDFVLAFLNPEHPYAPR